LRVAEDLEVVVGLGASLPVDMLLGRKACFFGLGRSFFGGDVSLAFPLILDGVLIFFGDIVSFTLLVTLAGVEVDFAFEEVVGVLGVLTEVSIFSGFVAGDD